MVCGRLQRDRGLWFATEPRWERTPCWSAKWARVAFITTMGFKDTIVIGRQARPKLYDWFQPAPQCLVPEKLRFGIAERTSAECEVIRGVDAEELDMLVSAIKNADVARRCGAFAVIFLCESEK